MIRRMPSLFGLATKPEKVLIRANIPTEQPD
jgi:hypothetical protein